MKSLTYDELLHVVGGGGDPAPPVVGGGSVSYTDPGSGMTFTVGGTGNSNGGETFGGSVGGTFGPGQSDGQGGFGGSLGVGNEGQNIPQEPTTGVNGPFAPQSNDDDRDGVDAFGRPLQSGRS